MSSKRYPDDEIYQVSHETIFRSLFIQARGALKKELLQYLRTQRMMRQSRKTSLKGKGLGDIAGTISIRERPASIEDRALPGRWEGVLLRPAESVAAWLQREHQWITQAAFPERHRSVFAFAGETECPWQDNSTSDPERR